MSPSLFVYMSFVSLVMNRIRWQWTSA